MNEAPLDATNQRPMPRLVTRFFQVGLDLIALSVAFWASWFFRFELSIPAYWQDVAFITWGPVVAMEYLVIAAFGVHRFAWRYVSIRETLHIALALATATGILVISRLTFDNETGA